MALDIAPAQVRKGESVIIGRSSGGLGSIQGLRSVRYGGERVVVNSWSSTQISVTVPSGVDIANSTEGYRFVISGLLLGSDQTALIPLFPSEGWDFVEVQDPVIDDGSLLRDSVTTVINGSQVVFSEFPGLGVDPDTQFSFNPMPSDNASIPYFVIGPAGDIMDEELFTFNPETPMAHPIITVREGVDIDIDVQNARDEDISGDIGG